MKQAAISNQILGAVALLGMVLAQPAVAAKHRPKKPPKVEATKANATKPVGSAEITAWLQRHYPGRTWQLGPIRLHSSELAVTYPNRQFWAVHSSPPMPGGAAGSAADSAKGELAPLSALVEVDVVGHIGPAHPEMGRLQAGDKQRAARVGAAVLSLAMGKWAPPNMISASDVQVERVPGYWQMTARGPSWLAQARVTEVGQLAAATRTYVAPMPP